jgi:hypothetical protein
LAWRFIQADTAKKDGMKSIRRSNWRTQVLSKTKTSQSSIFMEARKAFPTQPVLEVDFQLDNDSLTRQFEFVADPVYVDRLFSTILIAETHKLLLDIAPVYRVPPTKAVGAEMENRDEAEAMYLKNLCYLDIFEYNTKFPPVVAPEGPSLTSPHLRSLNMCQLSTELFAELAFSPDPGPLCAFEKLHFQRLALVLVACKRCGEFSSRVFPSIGAPYRCILQYVCGLVHSKRNIAGFNYVTAQQLGTASPHCEMLRLRGGGRVQIFMDANSPESPLQYPTREEVERYKSNSLAESLLTPAQRRRKRKEKRVASLQNATDAKE